MAPTEDAIKALVIEWLGPMHSDDILGPDYIDTDGVNALVASLMALIQAGADGPH